MKRNYFATHHSDEGDVNTKNKNKAKEGVPRGPETDFSRVEEGPPINSTVGGGGGGRVRGRGKGRGRGRGSRVEEEEEENDDEESSCLSALQSFMDDMAVCPFPFVPHESMLTGFPSLANQTTSNPDLFLSGVSRSRVDMNSSLSSDELNRSSVVSKRNEKGAAPLPIIDDSADNENENVFLTGFHLKDNFSVHLEEPDPREEDECSRGPAQQQAPGREDHSSSKEMRKHYRRYPPPMAGHLLADSSVLVDNIISKFNVLNPPGRPGQQQPHRPASPHKKFDPRHPSLFGDPLPRPATGDHTPSATQESPFPLTLTPALLDENVVEYRQRTAPARTFVAPDPTKRAPAINQLEQYTRRAEKPPKLLPPPVPVTYVVLDDGGQAGTTPNPRLVARPESTYRTLTAKRPPANTAQSFKSPRTGKAIKATSHASVFLSNEVAESSSLAKMLEVSSQLVQSKASLMRHVVKKADRAVHGCDPLDACAKIELKLAL